MRSIRVVLAIGVMLLAGVAPAAARQKAPILIDSTPTDGETVHEAPAQVEMMFSEPLDDSSTIEVRDECNRRVDNGEVSVSLNEMTVGIARTPSGLYAASYSATGVGGVTGTTRGSISFTVHMGPSCDGSGGGHGGHGGNGGGGGGGGHGGHGSGGDSDGGHTGGGHTGGGHTGGTTHAAGAHAPGGAGHGAHSKPGKKGRHGKHGKHKGHAPEAEEPPTTDLAAPGDLVPPPDGETLLIALGVSIVLGAGGGLLVRVGVRL